MASLNEIRKDLKEAMLAKDKLRTSTLRLLISAIKNKEIDSRRELNDEEMMAVLSTEVKKRHESVEEYKKGNRLELAEKEEQEAHILRKYLPKQLTDEELQSIVSEVITQTGTSSKKDMGKVMQQLMPKVRGRADGRKVSQLVNQKLEN